MEMVKKYHINDIIIAIPSATNKERRDILNICKDTGCKLRILPGMYQMVRGDIKVSQLREVRIEDLLEREPVEVDLDGIMDYVKAVSYTHLDVYKRQAPICVPAVRTATAGMNMSVCSPWKQ